MLINNSINSLASLYSTNTATRQAVRTQAARSFKDEMVLSAETRTFNEMLKKLRQETDVRLDKVNEYSAQLADGSYYASSDDIAASMLGLMH